MNAICFILVTLAMGYLFGGKEMPKTKTYTRYEYKLPIQA